MKTKRSKLKLKIPKAIYDEVLADLKRPHPFAYERVGFLSTAVSVSELKEPIVLVTEYQTIPNENYINDKKVGARINSGSDCFSSTKNLQFRQWMFTRSPT